MFAFTNDKAILFIEQASDSDRFPCLADTIPTVFPTDTGVPYSIEQCMSSRIVHQHWAGASGEEPMWVSKGLWIHVNNGLSSYCEDIDFEVILHAIGLHMAHESSEYRGYPIGDLAGLSYNILVSIQLRQLGILTQISRQGNLFQALRDYVQAYLTAIQANPMYQRQLHLPKHQQVPISDPPGPWDNVNLVLLGTCMANLDPKEDPLDAARLFNLGLTLWSQLCFYMLMNPCLALQRHISLHSYHVHKNPFI